ncbi:EAL domain-containing protein [Aliivibrio sp. S2TY2]|uniref:EAL domain-containing protein n=1 Tax=unclassified Aliivibrio TaxID=2645654 RepID=UPI0023785199|nr:MULTISPECIES: EAL domain-containing protein [unclassified Aliivibrio]MDD9173499.1 EAL domain-containing protein [Aliivibrio sp. S3TY1]MDD9190575.1 EAL domain-containing protein [Aliivibrio sp. S2TY2]
MNDFYFNYQPIMYKGKTKYYEALFRLYDKTLNIERYIRNVKSKAEFDLKVINQVLNDRSTINYDITLSVNISILSLESEKFIRELLAIPNNITLILEITEYDKSNNLKKLNVIWIL